jgi:predicted PurR-regulated permease PerM
VNHYTALKTVISIVTGVAAALWVWIMGVDFPIIWGVLAFLLNYVPNLGSIVAAIPPVLLGFVQYGWGTAFLVAAGYTVINLVVGNIIEPRFMGHGLGLSTLVVFLSLVFWGWLFGPVGMLLSVPLTMMVKIGLENKEDTRWMAILLGPESESAPAEKQSAPESDAAETAGKPA